MAVDQENGTGSETDSLEMENEVQEAQAPVEEPVNQDVVVEDHVQESAAMEEGEECEQDAATYEQDPQEYDLEQHNSDEYDPAENTTVSTEPLHDQDEYDPADYAPQHDADEYDPEHPSGVADDNSNYPNENYKEAHEDDGENAVEHTMEQEPATGASEPASNKRKQPETRPEARENAPTEANKRPRNDNPAPSSSARPKEDYKGLSEAAWDRLMDFQSDHDFRITQISRAAFASVGALPEFAQVSIIARFTRTVLKDVRDKNGLLMKTVREYEKENPHIRSLQHVSVYIDDYTAEPGIYAFGYAPPQPVAGMRTTAVPYHRDQELPMTKPSTSAASPRKHNATAAAASSTAPPPQSSATGPLTDEFGRTIVNRPAESTTKSTTATSTPTSASAPASTAAESRDPRRANRLQQRQQPEDLTSPQKTVPAPPATSTPAPVAPAASPGLLPTGTSKPVDPRKRSNQAPASETATASDASSAAADAPRAAPLLAPPSTTQSTTPSTTYSQLPSSVQHVLNSMYQEGRIHEAMAEQVLSRLLQLPEPVALQAVENFSNVDLSHIGDVPGFLLGIISRVHEKAIAAEAKELSVSAPTSGVMPYPSSMAPPPQQHQHQHQSYYPPQPSSHAPPPHSSQQQQQPPHVHCSDSPAVQNAVRALPLSVQHHLGALINSRCLTSIDEVGEKVYQVLGELSEPLANEVLNRFARANLQSVRNRSGFLMGVIKKCRQEYGFNG